ncbi:hypothetical protein BZG36_01754 [Bifiguratus adelaidae]|uniref:Uncharacterized protein n=1 Tax=Bifiguratus adelaidae TaxID=1938954 RepID=A0A261Y2U6_9FUNG|nr:hypothetical protein BZG36_01754 [Bifiguratus adelaidae]
MEWTQPCGVIPPTRRKLRHLKAIHARNVFAAYSDAQKFGEEGAHAPRSSKLGETHAKKSRSWHASDSSQLNLASYGSKIDRAWSTAMMKSNSSTGIDRRAPANESRQEAPSDIVPKISESHSHSMVDTFLTIRLPPESDAAPWTCPFFVSDTCTYNTINPSFDVLPTALYQQWVDLSIDRFIVEVWSCKHKECNKISPSAAIPEFAQLRIQWDVHLSGLVYLAKDLNHFTSTCKSNTILLELADGLYGCQDTILEPGLTPSRSLKDSVSKRSYRYNDVMRINTTQKVISDTQKSGSEICLKIEEMLSKSHSQSVRELDQRKSNLRHLQHLQAREKQQVRQLKAQIAERKEAVKQRRQNLTESTMRYQDALRNDLPHNLEILRKNESMESKIMGLLLSRRRELIADLFSIYPIAVDPESDMYLIRSLPLPSIGSNPSRSFTSNPPPQVPVTSSPSFQESDTALGYTAHLTSMIAYYIGENLRYPITPMGSKSFLTDLLTIGSESGDVHWPLYTKGVDKSRTEYGVFLLNKDIEQLMNSQGIRAIDIRHTLPNLHTLIQHYLTIPIDEKRARSFHQRNATDNRAGSMIKDLNVSSPTPSSRSASPGLPSLQSAPSSQLSEAVP